MTARFPVVLDAVQVREFRECPQRWWYGHVRGLRLVDANEVHLTAGKALARGLEVVRLRVFRDKVQVPDALHEAKLEVVREWGSLQPMFSWEQGASAKTLDRTLDALDFYVTQAWPPERDHFRPIILGQNTGVEFRFALPLPGVLHPDTGEPILYAGRFDMLGHREGRELWILDEKTTSRLGESWVHQWTMRSQFSGYAWAVREYGLPASLGMPFAGIVVRGLSFLKNSFGSAEVVTTRPDWKIDMWLDQTVRDVRRMIDMWTEKVPIDRNYDNACAAYGKPCPFVSLCDTNDPAPWESLYREEFWNPLDAEPLDPQALKTEVTT